MLEDYYMWIVMREDVDLIKVLTKFRKELVSKFFKHKFIDGEEILYEISCNDLYENFEDGLVHIYALHMDKMIDILFSMGPRKITESISISLLDDDEIENEKNLEKENRDLIIKIYEIINPLFIRTAYQWGGGDYLKEEIHEKRIYSLHWMQIFSEEMLDSINVGRLKSSDKFYMVKDLDDGSIFIQIAKSPFFSSKMVKELSDEIEIDCPEIYRWWEPKDI